MRPLPPALNSWLHRSLLPFWLVVALLPFGRSAELGTLLCLFGVAAVLCRDRTAWNGLPGARLWLMLLACYIGAACLSAFTAILPGRSWGTVLGLLRYIPLGLYACLVLRRERRLRGFHAAVAVVVAVWVLDAWMQMLTGWSLRGHAEPERITGLFGAGDPKLGPTLAVLSPFALWAARQRWGLRGLLAAFAVMLGPILLSGSRAAWIGYALAVLAFAWREAGSLRRFAVACVLVVATLAAAGAVAWKTSPRFDARAQRTLLVLGGSERDVDQATTGRLDIWRNSVAMIAAHPVTGVGVRDFRYAYPQYAPPGDHFLVAENCGVGAGACHPHQIVLEILTETGGVGLLLWLLGAVIAWRAWRSTGPAARAGAFPATVALVVTTFPFNTHLAFYSAWWGLLFAWLLGLWCAALHATAEEQNHGA